MIDTWRVVRAGQEDIIVTAEYFVVTQGDLLLVAAADTENQGTLVFAAGAWSSVEAIDNTGKESE